MASAVFILVTPVVGEVQRTVDGVTESLGSRVEAFAVTLVALQVLALACNVSAVVLALKDRTSAARRFLLGGALLGVTVVPVTTALSLAAYLLLRRASSLGARS